MAQRILVPRFRIRVLHPVTGAEITNNLPHAHGVTWEVLAPQAGASGGAQVGQFEIPLLPPRHRLYKAAAAVLSQLDYGMRVEAYLSPWGDSRGGDPYFSGYLRQLPRDTESHKLSGDDNVGLAQHAMVMRTEQFSGTTDALLKYALNGFTISFGDDFSGDLSAFTNNGSWTGPATDEGLATVAAGAAGDGLLYTTSSFNNAQYADCYVQADNWHLVCGTTPGNTAEAGIIAAVTDANNMVMGRALMTCISAGRFDISAEILQKSAGVWTSKALKARVITYPSSGGRLQVRLIGRQLTTTTYKWTVTIEGRDVGCTWTQTVSVGNPTGAVGLRSLKTGNSAGESASAHKVVFASKTALFQQGSIAAGSRSISQVVGGQAIGDLWVQAATTEGVIYKVRPKAGLFADLVDFGPTIGTDLSSSIELREGEHIVDLSLVPNHEALATGLISQAGSGPDNSGDRVWHNVAGAKKYNLLWDRLQMSGVADVGSQTQVLNSVSRLRGTPGQAKTLRVIFTKDLIGPSGGPVFSAGDYLKAHASSYGLFHQKFQVLGLKLTEGSPYLDVTGDQYPAARGIQQMRRLRATIGSLAAGFSNVAPTAPGGIVFDRASGSPNIIKEGGGYQGVDATHNYRLRFNIGANVQMIQRVLVFFSLQAWRASQQTTTGGASSGAGSNHTHALGTSGSDNSGHTHTLPIDAGPFSNAVGWDGGRLKAGGGGTSSASNGESATHTHNPGTIAGEAGHGHAIPSLNLNAPTGLIDQAMAQGVHVFLTDPSGTQTDITTGLGGPWGVGAALDVADLDISNPALPAFVNAGGTWEIQISSTTLGGIIATCAVVAVVGAL